MYMSTMDNEVTNMDERWYDFDPNVSVLLDVLKNVPENIQEEVLTSILKTARVIREKLDTETPDDVPVSIGKNRVLGLYMSSQKRRWYDENPVITNAFNVLATLPDEDCRDIISSILQALTEMGY